MSYHEQNEVIDLVKKFDYFLNTEEWSIPVSRRLAGFKEYDCEISKMATKHHLYIKAKINFLLTRKPNKILDIKKLKEEYEKSIRN